MTDRSPCGQGRPEGLIALDLLRFCCAMGVVCYHFMAVSRSTTGAHGLLALAGITVPRTMAAWAWWGWVGVDIFFVISGYVIAQSAEGSAPGAFLRRRALRLYPAALICATTTLLILLASKIGPAPQLFRSWAVSSLLLPFGVPVDASYWTLPVEICFYLLVAAGLYRGSSIRLIERLGWALGCACLITNLSGFTMLTGPLKAISFMFIYGADFALGIALAAHQGPKRSSDLRLGWIAAMAITSLGTVYGTAQTRAVQLGIEVGPTLPVIVAGLGIAIVAFAPTIQPMLARRRLGRHAAILGLMTYPLYLVHQDAGLAIIAAEVRAGLPFYVAVALTIALAVGFAWVIAIWAEPRLRGVMARAFRWCRGPWPDSLRSAFPRAG